MKEDASPPLHSIISNRGPLQESCSFTLLPIETITPLPSVSGPEHGD